MKRLKKIEGNQLPNTSWRVVFDEFLPEARI